MFGSVRFLVYTPTDFSICFSSLCVPFCFLSCSFFFNVGVIKLDFFLYGYCVSVYCPVAVSIIVWFVLCAWITRFQPLSHCMLSETVTMYGFRSDGSNGCFSHPSFSLIFPGHFHHPFHLVSTVCLPDLGNRFSLNSRICVVLSFFIILPLAFVFSFSWPFFATGICVQFLSLPV